MTKLTSTSTNFDSTSTEHAHDEAALVQDLWFEDGNLILQAENKLFRIYRGLLGKCSSVFKDMLAFPPPEGGNPMVDGCPIVTVYDSANDMGFFLKALFDSSYFEPPPTPTELPIVEAVLRLSLKYDVEYLYRRSLNHLSSTFPLTLDGWKQRDTLRTIPAIDNTPFAAFRIAREFNLTWLLPSILYCISSHPFEKTLDSAPWSGEDIAFCWEDKRVAIVGRQRLLKMQQQTALALAKSSCAQPEDCTGTACSATRLRCAEILSGWDMAGFLDYFEDHDETCEDFCQPCCKAFKELCASESESMWTSLPSMFGLPEWQELECMQDKALE